MYYIKHLINLLHVYIVGALRHSLQERLSKGASGKNRDEIYLKLRTSTGKFFFTCTIISGKPIYSSSSTSLANLSWVDEYIFDISELVSCNMLPPLPV